ncbi:hypothetical protein ACP4OV_016688 [Aristida adscensionis]
MSREGGIASQLFSSPPPIDPTPQHRPDGAAGPGLSGAPEPEMEKGKDFGAADANDLCQLLQRDESSIHKKRRYLLSLLPGPDGCVKSVKPPKFMKQEYLAESFVRADELSCERVRAYVERSFGFDRNGCNHHIVLDGVQLLNLPKEEGGSLNPDSMKIVLQTISKLSLEALHAVASIVTHNRISFEKTGPRMKNIIKDHFPAYLVHLDSADSKSPLYQVLTNPSSYQSDCIKLATPVTPRLLSSVNQALVGLNTLPMQALVAMNRKLRGESCPPRFAHEGRAETSRHIVKVIKKRCEKIISKLEEGSDLPKNLAKAMSVVNLCHKKDSRCMDISLSEFFPFSKQIISLQNDVLNALWSLDKMNHERLKLLRPILHQSSKDKKKDRRFSIAVRGYLVECLFECDEGNLPDEAHQVIDFLNQVSQRHPAVITEETKDAEAEAVLNLSSQLRAVTCYDAAGDPIDDQLMRLGSASPGDGQLTNIDCEDCNEDNDFVLTEGNYFGFNSQRNVDEACSSNSLPNAADTSGQYSSRTVGRSGYPPDGGHCRDSEVAACMMGPHLKNDVGTTNVEMGRSYNDLPEKCDKTALVAHKLIGRVLENMLLADNKEIDEPTRGCLGGGSISGGSQEDNQSADVVMNAVESVLPDLLKSCIQKVRRILSGCEQ